MHFEDLLQQSYRNRNVGSLEKSPTNSNVGKMTSPQPLIGGVSAYGGYDFSKQDGIRNNLISREPILANIPKTTDKKKFMTREYINNLSPEEKQKLDDKRENLKKGMRRRIFEKPTEQTDIEKKRLNELNSPIFNTKHGDKTIYEHIKEHNTTPRIPRKLGAF